jgi:hypothetical protein
MNPSMDNYANCFFNMNPTTAGADGRLPRRLKSHEMDEFLKSIYPHARTPQERMRECNIDLLKMANEIHYPEYAIPTTTVSQDDLFSEPLDPSIYDESFDEFVQYDAAAQGFGNSSSSLSSYPPSHHHPPVALGVEQTYTTNYNFLHTDSGMESGSSAMGSFGDPSSSYTSSNYPTPPELQASGTYTNSSISVGSEPSFRRMSSPPIPERQPSCNPSHRVPSGEHDEAVAPLVMVLNAKNMSTVAQRRRAKYTPAKRKEVHDTRKRGACEECRRRKKKVSFPFRTPPHLACSG